MWFTNKRTWIVFLVLILWFFSIGRPAFTNDCEKINLIPEDFAYHIYPVHHGECPRDQAAIRCHKYHWHWICRKGDVLFWDRRLETAARAACGCPPSEGVAPASPATSGLPHEDLIHFDGGKDSDHPAGE